MCTAASMCGALIGPKLCFQVVNDARACLCWGISRVRGEGVHMCWVCVCPFEPTG
jgi:hypothetical protein